MDHIVPLVLAPELALVRANLAAACTRCNQAKGGRTVEAWRRETAGMAYVSTPRLD